MFPTLFFEAVGGFDLQEITVLKGLSSWLLVVYTGRQDREGRPHEYESFGNYPNGRPWGLDQGHRGGCGEIDFLNVF